MCHANGRDLRFNRANRRARVRHDVSKGRVGIVIDGITGGVRHRGC